MIRKKTKRNILDHFDLENIIFSGQLSDLNFLLRLYPLKEMESYDSRYERAYLDIFQHTVNNYDYQGNWVFLDDRFQLLDGPDEIFLRFICEMAHPLVRSETSQANRIVTIANDWLSEDGWELYSTRHVAGGDVYSYRELNSVHMPFELDVSHIWSPGRLKFFVSHRDCHKGEAKTLANELEEFGISCFVAHDSIQPMSTWKDEIMKALQTMDACICYITSDFYQSPWTNQEIGYALARNIPIYLFSADKTDPEGFMMDTQAIKSGVPDLASCIKRDFSGNAILKKAFLDKFIDAQDGSFAIAKERFVGLLELSFDDSEIEEIVRAIASPTGKRERVNKLHALILDQVSDAHQTHPTLRKYKTYLECLEKEILSVHSSKEFKFRRAGEWRVEIKESKKQLVNT